MAEPKIIVKDLVKNFGQKEVLKGINFSVNKGESLVILVGSGSGKSVCINAITTLLRATSGSIKIDEEEVAGINGQKRDKLMKKFGPFMPATSSPSILMLPEVGRSRVVIAL